MKHFKHIFAGFALVRALFVRAGRALPLLALLPMAAQALTQNNVPYVDAAGNSQTPQNTTVVESGTTTLSGNETGGWYVVNSIVTVGTRITVTGTVNLILADGGNLNATNGINVSEGNTLVIWAQSGGTGALSATAISYTAGIGGGSDEAGGTITINGGTVEARSDAFSYCGAGIGGGVHGAGGIITINGGMVTATGSYMGSAGIGGGGDDVMGGLTSGAAGTIEINGGKITANGGYYGGAGIGSGSSETIGGSVTINGGTILVSSGHGANIGSGMGSGNVNVTINGGTTTNTDGNAARIGNGNYGGYGCTVKINGGSVKAEINVTPTSGSTRVYLNTLTVAGPLANTAITSAVVNGGTCVYGVTDVKTDADGKVYFWLPQNSSTRVEAQAANGNSYGETFDQSNNNNNSATLAQLASTVTLTGVAEVGGTSGTANSTSLTLTFDAAITDLTAGDVTLVPSNAVLGTPATSDNLVWSVPLTNVSAEGAVSACVRGNGTTGVIGSPQSVTIYQDARTPEATPSAQIDYVNELLTGLVDGGTYSFNNGGDVVLTGTTEYPIDASWFNTTLSVVKKGNGLTTKDSPAQSLPVPDRRAAPGVSKGSDETVSGSNDGQISSITADMEYNTVSPTHTSWTPYSGTNAFAPATYYVRFKSTNNQFVSAVKTVIIAAGATQVRTLTVTPPTFSAETYGYNRPAVQNITIANTGNSDATITSVFLSGTGANAFELGGSGSTVPHSGNIVTRTVQPKAGLDAGTYTATIEVSYDGTTNGNPNATNTVTFTVNPKDLSAADVQIAGTYIYTGAPQTPAAGDVTVTLAGFGSPLTDGTDYTYLVTSGGTDVGQATVTVTGQGNFTGTATGTFEIYQNIRNGIVIAGDTANMPATGQFVFTFPEKMDTATVRTVTIRNTWDGTTAELTGYFLNDSVTFVVDYRRLDFRTDYTLALSGFYNRTNQHIYEQTFAIVTQNFPSPPAIARYITLPALSGVVMQPAAGSHRIQSGSDFVFTLTPPAGMVPHVTTDRILGGAPETLKGTQNADGSYTFVIRDVRENITVSITFATGNEAVGAASLKVWPNPVPRGGTARLEYDAPDNTEVRIYTMQGTLVSVQKLQNGQATLTFPQVAGVYVVRVGSVTVKAIVN